MLNAFDFSTNYFAVQRNTFYIFTDEINRGLQGGVLRLFRKLIYGSGHIGNLFH
ncbi:flagellar basal body rod modification protein [Listeria monocytogenes]|nr:flagellar basal body rod modification protein [Listeria monocytogenes]